MLLKDNMHRLQSQCKVFLLSTTQLDSQVVELAHTYINIQQQEKSYMCMQMNT